MNGMIRQPAVAGLFYNGTESDLHAQIERCFLHPLGPGTISTPTTLGSSPQGLLCPHAGYLYSGPVAAHAYHRMAGARPEVVVLVGPNHHGLGPSISISNASAWKTPLGLVPVDKATAEAIASAFPNARLDALAHIHEHSIEVQLPFLQYLFGDTFSIVAITMIDQSCETSVRLGEAISEALGDRASVVIASSDMTHYVRHDEACERDRLALDAILSLVPARVEAVVVKRRMSICGPGPVMAMLSACRHKGATGAEMLKYATSGEVNGDLDRVVGYASVSVC